MIRPIGSCWLIGGPENAPETVMQVDRYGNTVPGEANARLIAAAPEMLEALELILESARDGRDVPEWLMERLIGAEAAIRKAEGS